MKYKLAGFTIILIVLAVSFLLPALAGHADKRIHQHISAEKKEPCTIAHEDGELCTHLPLVIIDTGGVEIPGKLVIEEKADGTYDKYYSTAEDGETRISAQIQVIDGEGYNHVGDESALDSKITIRVRGRSSRFFEKSSYAFTLINDDGTNNNQSVMGMDSHHDWVLYGPYLDKTDIRNYMIYNIAGEIMDYSPNVRYCELIVDGDYRGLYVMTESITDGVEGSRLGLEVNKRNQTYTGYLVRLDKDTISSNASTERIINSFTGYCYRRSTDMELIYPGPENVTEEMRRSISQDISDFEKMLYSYDYDSDSEGYKKYIDVESFIDALLISEVTVNYDFGNLSTYMYKDFDGLFRICLWDFNNSCDNYPDEPVLQDNFTLINKVWYFMLIKDEDFTERVIRRYRALREDILSTEYIDGYIDSVIDYLGDAISRDRARWESTYETGNGLLSDPERNPETYEDAVTQLKDFLQSRLEWMDDNIESLRQYSAESKVKKFSDTAS